MGKAAIGIELTETERRQLGSLARAQKTGQALARRARIVLAAAAGLENKAIGRNRRGGPTFWFGPGTARFVSRVWRER